MEEHECMVCFWQYDDEEHRPRFMPCGHTMCSKCLEDAIRKDSKICPICRTHYSASNLQQLPINFALESIVKLLNKSKSTDADESSESLEHQLQGNKRSSEADKLPECIEHQLPVSRRCSTHKSWVCKTCLKEEHSLESCTIITINKELQNKKLKQVEQSQLLLNIFEEACQKCDDGKEQCKKKMEENDEEILRYEAMAKRIRMAIQQKKSSKKKMMKDYSKFDQKIETIRSKKNSYNQAVISLKSSKSIRGVCSFSAEVQNEANKLQVISKEIDNEVQQIVKSFKAKAESNIELFLGNHKFSVRDDKCHLHAQQLDDIPAAPNYNFKFTDEAAPPVTDGMMTFLDLGIPGQESKRIYMKMLGNTDRGKQHLLLSTGQCGHSYKGLSFYPPCKPGQPGEMIILRPYDGEKAKWLLKDLQANKVVSHKKSAGLIHGGRWRNMNYVNRNQNALISFTLTDHPTKTVSSGFGIVTAGLETLQEIAKSNEINNIKVIDCGVVLPEITSNICKAVMFLSDDLNLS